MTMKRCSKCKKEKQETNFNWENKKKNKRHQWCKECTRKSHNKSYKKHKISHLILVKKRRIRVTQENRKYIYDHLLSHPCIDCGESDPLVLQFDHVKGKKSLEVSVMIKRGYSCETIANEISKCEVRCANCHMRKTAKQKKNWKLNFTPVVKSDMAPLS